MLDQLLDVPAGVTVLLADAAPLADVVPVAGKAVDAANPHLVEACAGLALAYAQADRRGGRRLMELVGIVANADDKAGACKAAVEAFDNAYREEQQDPDSDAAKAVRKVRKSELKTVLEAAIGVAGFMDEIEAAPGNIQRLAKMARQAKKGGDGAAEPKEDDDLTKIRKHLDAALKLCQNGNLYQLEEAIQHAINWME
jgi:hypothetical protein